MAKLPKLRSMFWFLLLASMFCFLLLTRPMLTSSTAQSQLTANDQYVQARITLNQLELAKQDILLPPENTLPPREDTLPPPQNERCANYARHAVQDYATMRKERKCLIGDNPRWQPNYSNHYQWCLTARTEWLSSENKARDNHLLRCGARFKF